MLDGVGLTGAPMDVKYCIKVFLIIFICYWLTIKYIKNIVWY